MYERRKSRAGRDLLIWTYLHIVHFILADDLDCNLVVLAGGVARAIDVAKGAIAHLFEKLPALEAGVLGKLGPAGIFLGHELGQVCLVYAFALTLGHLVGVVGV